MREPAGGVSYGLGNDRFPEGLHVCHIFNDDNERAATLARYFATGLNAGEQALCLFDAMQPDEVTAVLEHHGIDMRSSHERMVILPAEEAYCIGGTFVPDTCLAAFGQLSVQAREAGFAGTRIMGDMAWSLRRGTPHEAILEYESKVKDYIERFMVTAVCEYDARRFEGSLILDLLALHPATIVRGQIIRNPFYEEPATYLARLRDRAQPD